MTSLELGFVTDDAERLVAFYVAGFGFRIDKYFEFPQGSVHRLLCGDAQLKVYQPAAGAEHRPAAEPWHHYRGTGYGALHVDDAETVFDQAVSAGATVIVPVYSHRPGAKVGIVSDPDGNTWELLEESTP